MIAACLFLVLLSSAFALKPHQDPKNSYAETTILDNAQVMDVSASVNATAGGWVLYKQCDGRWGGNRLGTCSLTVCAAGCAMSSVAMMLKTKGANVDPGSLNRWLTQNGGYAGGCNIYWGKADAFGKTRFQSIQRASEAAICNGLNAGHGIIANVNNGGHWVLLTGCQGGGVFTVNDPGFNRATYRFGEIVQEAVYH